MAMMSATKWFSSFRAGTAIALFLLFVARLGTAAPLAKPAPAGAPAAPAVQKQPVLDGTFIQLVEKHGNWEPARWEKLFDELQGIGVRRVVVQWSLLDNRAFFATGSFAAVPKPPVETILALAAQRKMTVYLGLAADSQYWEKIKDQARREEYLKRLRWKSERVARELVNTAARYPSFAGWYLPEEIDDLNWREPAARTLLYRHVAQTSAYLKQLTPRGEVLISGFTRGRMDPETYREFWRELLQESAADELLFQDGAGTGQLPGALLPIYLAAVRGAADDAQKRLQVVVELFTLLSEAPFKAVPAPFARVKGQLQQAAQYASGGIEAFSVPDYLSPDAGPAAGELLREYRKYLGTLPAKP
ncbi:DUF4434 domain-containing protein [Geomesophilobacter sediminis]|uniref:DUF4434 domain-containing protein n=1 Tax=Geomesophilobacter sediminis TaxID=2798584 RepID=A0A8J7SAC7_9BACT|nr:DUF4434 domain-containing protein [Geomesophilobacter sediminis]MBJ6727405.1 DUF4434 domain-containing protein [Geomesophilobacter sediminis]